MNKKECSNPLRSISPLPPQEEAEKLAVAERIRINLFHLLSLTRSMIHEKVLPEEPLFNNLKLSHFRLLEYLWHNRDNPRGVRLKDVSQYLKITPGGVSQMVESLVRSGIIRRIQSEEDRRSIQLSLSEKGEKLSCCLEDFFAQMFREALQELPDEKQNSFLETLELLTKHISSRQESATR